MSVSEVRVLSKRMNESISSWFLAWELPSTHPILCYKEILVPPKLKVLSSGTLSQTLDLENFATASRWCCEQNSSTVELVDYTYQRVVAARPMVYDTSVDCNPLTPLFRFVLDLLYNYVQQLARFRLARRVARSVCGSRAS